jgi:hypothetical protein
MRKLKALPSARDTKALALHRIAVMLFETASFRELTGEEMNIWHIAQSTLTPTTTEETLLKQLGQ